MKTHMKGRTKKRDIVLHLDTESPRDGLTEDKSKTDAFTVF